MEYPNKTFILEKVAEVPFGDTHTQRKHIILIVASDVETATKFLRNNLGFEGNSNELTWLPNLDHPTIYNQNAEALKVQAKILYNTVTLMK